MCSHEVVVLAPGVEDVCDPAWHQVAALRALGHVVHPFCPRDAERWSPGQAPGLLAWLFRNDRPDRLVVGPDVPAGVGAEARRLAAAAGATVLGADRLGSRPRVSLSLGGPARDEDAGAAVRTGPARDEGAGDVLLLGPAIAGLADLPLLLADEGLEVEAVGEGWLGAGRVRRRCPVTLLHRSLARARVVVATGDRATAGIHALEAAAAGRPVVTLAVLDAWLEPGREYERACAPIELIVAVRRLLDDPSRRRALGAAARARVERDGSWEAAFTAALPDTGLTAGSLTAGPDAVGPGTLTAVRDRAPRVSVYMPTYQVAEYLQASVGSILGQTYDDFELIIVDDGSTDGTAALLDRFAADARVRVFRSENVGQTGRFDILHRRGMRAVRGELIAFMGSDDVSRPDRLAVQTARFATDAGLDLLHSPACEIDGQGRRGGFRFTLTEPYDEWSALRALMTQNFVAAPSVMMRRRAFEQLGGFERGFAADYHLWLKAAASMRSSAQMECVVDYRVHVKGASTVGAGATRSLDEGRAIRRCERAEHGIEEFYPELAWRGDDPRSRAAAHVDLGNRLLFWILPDPEAALAEYATAATLVPGDPVPLANQAIALAAAGAPADGVRLLGQLAERLRSPAALDLVLPVWRRLLDVSQPWSAHQVLLPGTAIDPELFLQPPGAAPDWDWTGSPPTTALRGLVVVDWADAPALARLLEGWCAAFAAGEPVELVLALLGTPPDTAIARLAAAAPHLDLTAAAPVVIEAVEHPQLVPPGWYDHAGVLTSEGSGAGSAQRWMHHARRALDRTLVPA